jgi:hypothetical protein
MVSSLSTPLATTVPTSRSMFSAIGRCGASALALELLVDHLPVEIEEGQRSSSSRTALSNSARAATSW